MKQAFAEAIVQAAHDNGDLDVKVYNEYSGRGMYGKTTAGVVVPELGVLLAAICTCTIDMTGDDQEGLATELRNTHSDNLGRNSTIYY